jgi:hypothetical protein
VLHALSTWPTVQAMKPVVLQVSPSSKSSRPPVGPTQPGTVPPRLHTFSWRRV